MPIGERFPQVLSAAKEGADWAWTELYHEFAPGLLRFLRASGAPEPEDALGDSFVQLVRNLPSFTGDERAFRAWVFTVARSRLVDVWRAGGRRPLLTPELPDREASGAGASVDQAILQHNSVAELLDTLTPDQRAVLVLRVLDQLSIEETATVLGRSQGSVKLLQHRALGALRRRLEQKSPGRGSLADQGRR